jgi:hypothetical protein
MSLKDIIGPYSLVFKENSPNVPNSVKWYESKLNLVRDPRYDVPAGSGDIWSQLNIPELKNVAVGLSKGSVGADSSVLTFVVPDIRRSRDKLIAHGVPVKPIHDVGSGVSLAFFEDDAKNPLCLRQNSNDHPQEFF